MANYQYENSGAIVDVDNAVRVTFDLNPESFNDTKGTEFASVAIPGMRLANSLAKRRRYSLRAAASAF